jgi:hypothetical protein
MPREGEIVDPTAVINGYGDEQNSTANITDSSTEQADSSTNETDSGNGTESNETANIPKELLLCYEY